MWPRHGAGAVIHFFIVSHLVFHLLNKHTGNTYGRGIVLLACVPQACDYLFKFDMSDMCESVIDLLKKCQSNTSDTPHCVWRCWRLSYMTQLISKRQMQQNPSSHIHKMCFIPIPLSYDGHEKSPVEWVTGGYSSDWQDHHWESDPRTHTGEKSEASLPPFISLHILPMYEASLWSLKYLHSGGS